MGGTTEKEASPGKNLEKTQHLRSRIMQIQHIDSGRTANKTGGKLGLWSQMNEWSASPDATKRLE